MGFIYKPGQSLESLSKGTDKIVITQRPGSKQYTLVYWTEDEV